MRGNWESSRNELRTKQSHVISGSPQPQLHRTTAQPLSLLLQLTISRSSNLREQHPFTLRRTLHRSRSIDEIRKRAKDEWSYLYDFAPELVPNRQTGDSVASLIGHWWNHMNECFASHPITLSCSPRIFDATASFSSMGALQSPSNEHDPVASALDLR
jgi:hypothetical protein